MTNFNSKETYLAARAEWKANYARLTTQAREARKEFNEAARVFSKSGRYMYGHAHDNTAFLAAEKALYAARSTRNSIRVEANNELADLAEMKIEACRQWKAKMLAVA